EKLLPYAIRTFGSKSLFWATDFPHEKTVQSTQREIKELMEMDGLSEEDLENLMSRSCERFYTKTPRPASA
ncbi:MAG TPA: hypothetical protein VJT77_12880, partial [Burkholderiales bacterium]|nr:hypothetical protein [Burkholderiales bacterium]